MMLKYTFYKCLIFRLLSLIVIQTYFVADEYWQSLEVAHAASFGYGYYTWEYKEEIRSIAYPTLFSILYKALQVLHLDHPFLIIYAPRLFQAFLTAIADYNFVQLCISLNLPQTDIWNSILFDWFGFFCGSRTIINTFEANLVTFGLCIFPWQTLSNQSKKLSLTLFGFLVFSVCWLRPTAILIWGPFLLYWVIFNKRQLIVTIVRQLIFPFLFTTFAFLTLDSCFYGHLTLTPYNFLYFNVFKGIASFYGSHPFYWYFSQGLLVALGLLIFPFFTQSYCTLRTFLTGNERSGLIHHVNMLLISSILSSLCFLSFIQHKEFRFLLPLIPMMKIIIIQGLSTYRRGKYHKILQTMLIVGFIIPCVLFGQFHQRGTLSVMKIIQEEAMSQPENSSVLILTPCHATPLYSHIHVNISVRFITCEPPITKQHIDESEQFYENPLNWLQNYFLANQHKLPTHVIMFDSLLADLNQFLTQHNYTLSYTLFHTLFPDGRVGKNIVVYNSL